MLQRIQINDSAFLAIFKRLRQAQAGTGRLRHVPVQPAQAQTLTGPDRHNRLMTAVTGPDSKILFLYQNL